MDILTLSYVNLLIGLSGAILLALIYRNARHETHLVYWSLANALLFLNGTIGVLSQMENQLIHFSYWQVPALANVMTVSLHAFMLIAVLSHTAKLRNFVWLPVLLLTTFALHFTEFSQTEIANRLVLNYPIIISLNAAAIWVLLREPKSAFTVVYRCLVFAFAINIAQMVVRLAFLLMYKLNILDETYSFIIHSIGYYGLTCFIFMVLGSCLFLVYKKHSILLRDSLERDPLTDAYNRHSMTERLQCEFFRTKRLSGQLSFIMFDIDHFKKVNDTFGHLVGDIALKHVVTQVKKLLRQYDSIFRFGGEEFLICLPDTSKHEASLVAERLRQEVDESNLEVNPNVRLSISLGVASLASDGESWQDLLQQADAALYKAKQKGRNQFWHYSELQLEAN